MFPLAFTAFGFLALGAPVAFALGMAGLAYLVLSAADPATLASQMFSTLNTATLMTIPFFVLSAEVLSRCGATRHLVDLFSALIGHYRGGLPVVAVISCAFFSAICGSSTATAAAVGVVLIPELISRGYDKRFAVGLVATAGGLGILIPPSIPLILYGLLTDTSVGALFQAAMLPGLTLAVLLGLVAYVIGRRQSVPLPPKASAAERLAALKKASGILLMPAIVLGGLYLGIFTPTEASAIAASYSIILAVTVYRTKLSDLLNMLIASAATASLIMLILVAANLVGYALTNERVPHLAFEWVRSFEVNKYLFMIALMGVYIVAGMFLEIISIILITVPILLPILVAMDVNLIGFAILLVVNMELAVISPPIGLNLFVISGISRVPVVDVFRGTLPFACVLLVMLVAMIFIPGFIFR
ncbi:TRAP transporter large permease [Enterovirga sp. CN4-39]|uniref:TRAP transporter large permease n=1 Tax=Enterovirga sp. CN4-39 TaxID=3400910 RepID=UPI003C05C684